MATRIDAFLPNKESASINSILDSMESTLMQHIDERLRGCVSELAEAMDTVLPGTVQNAIDALGLDRYGPSVNRVDIALKIISMTHQSSLLWGEAEKVLLEALSVGQVGNRSEASPSEEAETLVAEWGDEEVLRVEESPEGAAQGSPLAENADAEHADGASNLG